MSLLNQTEAKELPMQQTVAHPISFEGVGIHSGQKAMLTLSPAQGPTDIRFIRNGQSFSLSMDTVHSANRATILKGENFQVLTPEHILAALYGLDIYHVDIKLTSDECPIMDGAADVFVQKIIETGTKIVSLKRETSIVVESPKYIEWPEQSKSFTLLPEASGLRITYIAHYPKSFVGAQIADIMVSPTTFQEDIAMCRTYGFESEIESLKERGLIKGASLDNAILIGKDGYSSELRAPNELARHKILDILGDIAVIGKKVQGHIIANKTGHEENIQLAKLLLDI